jgi:hypothetical protein
MILLTSLGVKVICVFSETIISHLGCLLKKVDRAIVNRASVNRTKNLAPLGLSMCIVQNTSKVNS